MPDLGKYATEVLSAYAVSLLLLLAIVVASVMSARRARAALDAAETEEQRNAR